ncbi:hypothetical protein MLD52_16295 [Puniceicoccaceae bacterium K14]|nr:hypothetical protein [Puniceicoccaceae bacterium K14]
MDWLFDNLGKFVPLLIGLFYFISSLNKDKSEEEAEQSPEAQERARRIQEEIRRKILERQGDAKQQSGGPLEEAMEEKPPIVFYEEERYDPMVPELPREAVPAPTPEFIPEYEAPSQLDRYEEQRREVAQKLEDARRLKEKLANQKASRVGKNINRSGKLNTPLTLRESLYEKQSLRNAIILKEVLGEPVGMRRF